MVRGVRDGTLTRNGNFGLRTRITKSSDNAWNVGHRAAAPLLKVTAACGLAGALLAIIIGFSFRGNDSNGSLITLAVLGAGYIVVIALIVAAARVADRAAENQI